MKNMKTALSAVLASAMIFGAAMASAETYSASAKGFGGDVTVTVTVEDGKIAAAEAAGISETPALGGAAMPQLCEPIVANQTPYVDTVSGATLTSNAVIEAAAAALAQAGLTFEKAEVVKGEDEVADCDVLVIGMGASGTTAALSAAENGAKVIGVESSTTLGGMGNAAQGMFAIGTTLQQERYGDDLGSDEEYWFNKYMEQSNELGNAALIRTFVGEAKNTVQYLLDHDINVYLSKTAQQVAHFDETIIYHRWNNTQPFVHFQEYLDKNGVDIRWNTTATQLDSLRKERSGALYDLMDALDSSAYDETAQGEENYILAQNKLWVITGEVSDFSAQIAALTQQSAQVQAQLGTPTQIAAPQTGYFIRSTAAGRLNAGADDILALDAAGLEAYLNSDPELPLDGCAGKLVSGFTWRYVGLCSAQEGEKLLGDNGKPLTRSVTIKFPGQMETPLKASESEVSND